MLNGLFLHPFHPSDDPKISISTDERAQLRPATACVGAFAIAFRESREIINAIFIMEGRLGSLPSIIKMPNCKYVIIKLAKLELLKKQQL